LQVRVSNTFVPSADTHQAGESDDRVDPKQSFGPISSQESRDETLGTQQRLGMGSDATQRASGRATHARAWWLFEALAAMYRASGRQDGLLALKRAFGWWWATVNPG
jgi:hypothetical protein